MEKKSPQNFISQFDTSRGSYKLVHYLGIGLWLPYLVIDYIVYPKFITELFWIRAFMTFYFILSLKLTSILPKRWAQLLMQTTLGLSGLAITVMCYITGDGLNSTYYGGIVLVITASSALLNMTMRPYLLLICTIIFQHFGILFFLPWTLQGLMNNLFFLVVIAIAALLVHYKIVHLLGEVRQLRSFLPICARCKKIRNDGGYWQQVEGYFSSVMDVEFTHGCCPECMERYHEEIAKIKSERE